MSTYYGYAEREAEDNINWSVVGSDITKMLQEEVTRREVLKKEIDDASRKFGQTLSEAPTGTHKGANDFITGYANDASQARLMQDRLLKSGQLKVKDYLLQRANLTDGTKGIFNVAKNFQAEFKRKADRMTKDESAKLEQTLFQMTEGFANFNNSGAYINPTNFQVSVAKKNRVKDKDGNFVYQMSDNPQDFFTVNELNTFVSLDLDRFDTEGALNKIADAAGARDQSIRYYDKETDSDVDLFISDVTGDVYEKNLSEDQRKLVDSYKEAEEDAIEDILANPYNAASILTDYVGKGYDFTFDPKEAAKDDKMILLEKDPGGSGLPKVVLSDPQKEELKQTLSEGIKFRLDQKYIEKGTRRKQITPRTTPEDKTEKRKKKDAQSEMDTYSVWLKPLIEGDADEKSEALSKFANRNPDKIETIEFVIREDGTSDVEVLGVDGTRTTVLTDWESRTNREIADAFLNNELFPTLSDKALERYESTLKATGVLGIDKVAPYAYVGASNLYDFNTSSKEYVRSAAKKYTFIPEEEMMVASSSGIKARPSVIYRDQFDKGEIKEADGDQSVDSFINNINLSYLGTFTNPKQREQQNPFKRIIKGVRKAKYDDLPNAYTGDEWDNVIFEVDPKYGESFSIPMSKEVQGKIPEIMDLLQKSIIADDNGKTSAFTREDIYRIVGGESVSEIKAYNDALLRKGAFGSTDTETPDTETKQKKTVAELKQMYKQGKQESLAAYNARILQLFKSQK